MHHEPLSNGLLITGASSGLGAEVARLARLHGATVIGVDRNDPMIAFDGFVKAEFRDEVRPLILEENAMRLLGATP